jgi:hypothetical protein
MFSRWLIVAVSAALVACAAPRAKVLNITEHYPPGSREVEVLLDPPKRPYRSFAILEDVAGGTPEEINRRLAQRAQELGADAILITEINDRTVTDWIVSDPYYVGRGYYYPPRYRPIRYTYHSVRAKAIRYLPK